MFCNKPPLRSPASPQTSFLLSNAVGTILHPLYSHGDPPRSAQHQGPPVLSKPATNSQDMKGFFNKLLTIERNFLGVQHKIASIKTFHLTRTMQAPRNYNCQSLQGGLGCCGCEVSGFEQTGWSRR